MTGGAIVLRDDEGNFYYLHDDILAEHRVADPDQITTLAELHDGDEVAGFDFSVGVRTSAPQVPAPVGDFRSMGGGFSAMRFGSEYGMTQC